MDSYDYTYALDNIVPALVPEKEKRGNSLWVLRPDSGDPTEVILQALAAADKAVGHTVNSKGFKVLNGINAIQVCLSSANSYKSKGDGIGLPEIKKICDAVIAAGYSVSNVAFGMGSGLLQKLNRDTMSFATKLSYIEYAGEYSL